MDKRKKIKEEGGDMKIAIGKVRIEGKWKFWDEIKRKEEEREITEKETRKEKKREKNKEAGENF